MREFDDNIPAYSFDNFQFVNFTEIMTTNVATIRKEIEFALSALMEIPTQYKATIELNILGSWKEYLQIGSSFLPLFMLHQNHHIQPAFRTNNTFIMTKMPLLLLFRIILRHMLVDAAKAMLEG